ncbi:DUF6612 family protein [Oceanobacillus sp. CFH 90083]|uniref:DUF6612 family protein n=1 Tax=Oceanobacillus sp. CFH 90083 TaxID=2592336 RepID=UPI00128C26C3|nr:DUF6612 family protein [Oceanobacillus sp. CFH 90083]
MKKYIVGVGLFILICIAGCSSPDSSEILGEAEQVEQSLDSLDVDFEENREEEAIIGNAVFDYENNIDYYNLGSFALYRDGSSFLTEFDDGTVTEGFEGANAEQGELEEIFNSQLDMLKMPIAFFLTLDPDIHNKFDVETRDNDYVLTYNGNETDIEELGRAIIEQNTKYVTAFSVTEIDQSDLSIDAFSLEIMIEKETHQLQQVKQELAYTLDDFSNIQNYTHVYSNHNNAEQIEIPAVAAEAGGADSTEVLSDAERKALETEASAYLDALIQATVFQNAEEFINRAPDNYSEDEKKTEAETQRDFFKSTYIQNTEQNMQSANVTGEEIIELADAVMYALSTAEYEMVDAHAESTDNIIVTISVKGISDTSIYQETEQELIRLYEDGEITNDEIDSKNLEILIEKYHDIDELLDPVELDVHVMQDPAGTYVVLMQDQYLAGFIQ